MGRRLGWGEATTTTQLWQSEALYTGVSRQAQAHCQGQTSIRLDQEGSGNSETTSDWALGD